MRPSYILSAFFLPLFSSATSSHTDSIVDWDHLSSLLDSIDDTVLHGVLHQLSPKFQDGVFSKDRSALEHVHSESPAVATKLVHIAIKRQSSNATTTAANQQSAITSALQSQIEASTVPAATTVIVPPSAPADSTPIATEDGGIVYSTYGGGLVTLTSSAVGVRFTPSTSTHLYYSTLPNGDVQTSTSVVVVNAPVTGSTETAAAGAAASSGSDPGLQDAASGLEISAAFLALAGLGGLAFLLL